MSAATVDSAELRLALRALTKGGDGEAALASALEASAGRILPRYKLPQVFAGLRRSVDTVLLSLGLLVATPDGVGFRVEASTTPERIEAALADQAREREARRAARAAAAARRSDSSPAAVAARLEAYRERKARNKADQRARERGAAGALEGEPTTRAFREPLVTTPVTALQPVTSGVVSPTPDGDMPPPVTAPVTDSHASARPAASDPPSSPDFKIPGGGEGFPSRETVTVTIPPSVTPSPSAEASTEPKASPDVSSPPAPVSALEAQLGAVLTAWVLAFARVPVTENNASESDRAVVLQRLREPGGLEHVLLAVRRAARPGSWFWKAPGRCALKNICGTLYPSLVSEALDPPTSTRSPAPPLSSPLPPPASSPSLARTSLPAGWPEPVAKLPRSMPVEAFPGADKDEPLSWSGGMWVYNYNSRLWELFGLDPNTKQRAG